MPPPARKKLGELLIDAGVIDEGRLRAALLVQQRTGGKLGRVLLEMNAVGEQHLVKVLSEQMRIPMIDLDQLAAVPPEVLALVSAEYAEQRAIVPVAVQGKFFDVAMADPTDMHTQDELQVRTRLNVRPQVTGPLMMERAIGRFYGRGVAATKQTSSAVTRVSQLVAPRAGVDLSVADDTAEIMKKELDELKALVARDEDVLRNLIYLLMEKGVLTREEVLARLMQKK
jgi:hypothetical protein